MSSAPRPDVSTMTAVHQVFHDTLACAPTLIGAVESDDEARTALVANFYENMLAFLHVHHEGEEELVFPLLRQRCPDQVELVERVAGQHRDVLEAMAASRQGLALWSGGESSAREPTLRALERLGQEADVHFIDEETDLLPLCADVLSFEEWEALPGHGMRHFEGDKVWLILGLIRQRMSEAQRVEMWTSFGEGAFAALMAEVGPPLG